MSFARWRTGVGARPQWLAYIALASSMALVGSYVGLSRLLLDVFPLFVLAWLRFGIAAIAMAGWWRAEPEAATLTAKERVFVFLQSFFGNFLFSICMLGGMQRSTAVSAGVVMATIPAMVAVLSWLVLKEQVKPRTWLAVGCAVVGISLVALARDSAASGPTTELVWLGPVLLLAAVACEALYVVIGKRLTERISPKRLCAQINAWGLVLITPLGAWHALHFDFGAPGALTWAQLVFYALAASVVTVWLWMWGLQTVPAASAGVFTVMLPIGAAAVGVLLLGEKVSLLQFLAFAIALLGVFLATQTERVRPDR